MKKYYLFLFIGVVLFIKCDYNYLENSKRYSLRDRGPAGGWIFYINPNFKADGWRYLEAAPEDQTSRTWGTVGLPVPGADGTAIGTGKQNTLDIIAGDPWTNKAAEECFNYKGGGYSDWFLPSKDELWMMCWNLQGIKYDGGTIQNPNFPVGGVGGFSPAVYWSSSETVPDGAWHQAFTTGQQWGPSSNKNSSQPLRAVRAF